MVSERARGAKHGGGEGCRKFWGCREKLVSPPTGPRARAQRRSQRSVAGDGKTSVAAVGKGERKTKRGQMG